MKTFILWSFLFPHHYQIYINSAVGQGCSHVHFTKSQAAVVQQMFFQAPIPAQYEVWVQDTRKHDNHATITVQPQAAPVQPDNNEKL